MLTPSLNPKKRTSSETQESPSQSFCHSLHSQHQYGTVHYGSAFLFLTLLLRLSIGTLSWLRLIQSSHYIDNQALWGKRESRFGKELKSKYLPLGSKYIHYRTLFVTEKDLKSYRNPLGPIVLDAIGHQYRVYNARPLEDEVPAISFSLIHECIHPLPTSPQDSL